MCVEKLTPSEENSKLGVPNREWALGEETYMFDDEYGDSYYMYKVS